MQEPEQRDSNILALIPGDLLTGLSVFQIDQPHQQTLLQVAAATAREAGAARGIRGSAIFRGTGGGDVAIFTQWMTRRDYDQARRTLLTPPEQDLYRIAVVDHTSGQNASRVAREDGLFHFINVFSLAPGRCDDFVDYFQQIIPIARVQPGYVSTNLLVSLDARHAVNIGQFKARHDFLAFLRQPPVIMAFAQGFLRRIVPRPPRLRQYELVAVFSHSDTHA